LQAPDYQQKRASDLPVILYEIDQRLLIVVAMPTQYFALLFG